VCEGDGWLDGGTVVDLVQCEDGVEWRTGGEMQWSWRFGEG